jgi:hypothetical protein
MAESPYDKLSEHERSKREIRTLASNPNEAQKFIDSTKNYGGASMFLNSMKMPEPGDKTYIVGKEKSQATGKPVPTHYENPGKSHLTPRQFAYHFNRLGMESKDPKAMMGSWVDSKTKKGRAKGVQIDLSTGYKQKGRAEDKMIERNEDAIWNMKSMRNIRNEAARKRRGIKEPRPPKED